MRLNRRRTSWARLALKGKIAYLREVQERTLEISERAYWVTWSDIRAGRWVRHARILFGARPPGSCRGAP
jgi:hypothetical protein